MLGDQTKARQYLNEIKDSVVFGFQPARKDGPNAEKPVRLVHFNTLRADAIHPGGGQLISTTCRVLHSADLLAEPGLLDSVYLIEIYVLIRVTEYGVLTQRRGSVVSKKQ